MRVLRLSLMLGLFALLSISLAGTALAHKPDKDERHGHRVLIGLVDETPSGDSVKLRTKRHDVVTVNTADATFRVPASRWLGEIIAEAQDLQAGDRVLVQGRWTGEQAFTAKRVLVLGKTLERFVGEVTAVSASELTVQRLDDDGDDDEDVETRVFDISDAIVKPDDVDPQVGDKVKVVYRAETNDALAVLVKTNNHDHDDDGDDEDDD